MVAEGPISVLLSVASTPPNVHHYPDREQLDGVGNGPVVTVGTDIFVWVRQSGRAGLIPGERAVARKAMA